MNSKTKIVVLRQKHLIAGIIALLGILLLLVLCLMGIFSGSDAAVTTSQQGEGAQYKPGVYTASVIINGSPMDIRLTVDENNINDIELLNVSETITTMYPLIENSFEDIKTQVMESGSTEGINFTTENTYSSTTIINAIEIVLKKARVK